MGRNLASFILTGRAAYPPRKDQTSQDQSTAPLPTNVTATSESNPNNPFSQPWRFWHDIQTSYAFDYDGDYTCLEVDNVRGNEMWNAIEYAVAQLSHPGPHSFTFIPDEAISSTLRNTQLQDLDGTLIDGTRHYGTRAVEYLLMNCLAEHLEHPDDPNRRTAYQEAACQIMLRLPDTYSLGYQVALCLYIMHKSLMDSITLSTRIYDPSSLEEAGEPGYLGNIDNSYSYGSPDTSYTYTYGSPDTNYTYALDYPPPNGDDYEETGNPLDPYRDGPYR